MSVCAGTLRTGFNGKAKRILEQTGNSKPMRKETGVLVVEGGGVLRGVYKRTVTQESQ